jgi:DNA primase
MDYAKGLWHCFGCGAGGDAFDFLGYALFLEYDRHTHFGRLLDMLAGLQVRPLAAPELQALPKQPAFTLEARRLEAWEQRLFARPDLLEWLAARGIDAAAARHWRLGATDMGQIAIPHFYRGVVVAVKLRRHPESTAGPKYVSVKGSSYSVPFNADMLQLAQPQVAILETELDAIACQTLTGIPSVSLPAGQFKAELAARFLLCKKIIAILDNDAAGITNGSKIKSLLRRATFRLPPSGKDLGDWIREHPGQPLDWIIKGGHT